MPELGLELPGGPSTSGREAGGAERAQASAAGAHTNGRRRVRSPADKEHKRLKRCVICFYFLVATELRACVWNSV